jgi:hypothetical protein
LRLQFNIRQEEGGMKNNYQVVRLASALTLAVFLIAGCESKQDKAIDAAKKQAAASGQPQQVTTVDSNGTTTTTTVQPPAPGQTATSVTTTTAPTQAAPGTPPPQPGVYYQPAGTAQATPPATPAADQQQPQQAAPVQATAPPVAPAEVNIPAGSELTIRINQSINSRTTPPGSRFTGEMEDGWTDRGGRVILPRGTHVEGEVVESHNGGHFKGASVLELRLTSLTLSGTRYPLDTHDVVRERKGKGKRTAGFIGGGGGLGAIIGGIAGGGKGALIGGLAGAGAGTAGAGLTDNHPLDIPAESIVRFRLKDELTLQR